MGNKNPMATEDMIHAMGLQLLGMEGSRYKMRCPMGHLLIHGKAHIRQGQARCSICDGNQMDYTKAQTVVKHYGYTLVDAEIDLDRYGNDIVKAATRIRVACSSGHEITSMCISDIRRGKQCPYCTDTIRNAGYSRGEEVIATVLDLNNIRYIRQHPIDVVVNGTHRILTLDFYLPDLSTIIEYDGAQHKYGRSDSTPESLEETARRDEARDIYAQQLGIRLLRADGVSVFGKAIVFWLQEQLGSLVDLELNRVYDQRIKTIYDTTAARFNWNPYDYYKCIAEARFNGATLEHMQVAQGVHSTRVNKAFRLVYGVSYKEHTQGKRTKYVVDTYKNTSTPR